MIKNKKIMTNVKHLDKGSIQQECMLQDTHFRMNSGGKQAGGMHAVDSEFHKNILKYDI